MTRKGSLGPKKALANAKASRKACMARLRERVEQAINLQRAQQLDSDDDSPMPSAKKAKAKANQEAHAPDNAPAEDNIPPANPLPMANHIPGPNREQICPGFDSGMEGDVEEVLYEESDEGHGEGHGLDVPQVFLDDLLLGYTSESEAPDGDPDPGGTGDGNADGEDEDEQDEDDLMPFRSLPWVQRGVVEPGLRKSELCHAIAKAKTLFNMSDNGVDHMIKVSVQIQ